MEFGNRYQEKLKDYFNKNIRSIVLISFVMSFIFIAFYSYASYREQTELNIDRFFYEYESEYNDFIAGSNKKWLNSLDVIRKKGEEFIAYENGQKLLYLVAITHYKNKEYSKAVELFEKIISSDPSIYVEMSIVFLASLKEKKDRPRSIELLKDFMKKHKDSFLYSKVVYELGRYYISINDYGTAKNILLENMDEINDEDRIEIKKLLAYISFNEK